jgi:hypothetical protein
MTVRLSPQNLGIRPWIEALQKKKKKIICYFKMFPEEASLIYDILQMEFIQKGYAQNPHFS